MSTSFSGNLRLDTAWADAYTEAERIVEAELGWTKNNCVTMKTLRESGWTDLEAPHNDYCDFCREVQRVAEDIRFANRRGT